MFVTDVIKSSLAMILGYVIVTMAYPQQGILFAVWTVIGLTVSLIGFFSLLKKVVFEYKLRKRLTGEKK